MFVTCDKCKWEYDDAKRWTLCPHPDLDDWDARATIQRHKEIMETIETQKIIEKHEEEIVQRKKSNWHVFRGEPRLTTEQVQRLCTILGIPQFPVTRILIDIDCESRVSVYTCGFVPVGAFDEILTMLASLKEQPNANQETDEPRIELPIPSDIYH